MPGEGTWGGLWDLGTEGQHCQWPPWLPGDREGWERRREEVKPLGNPLSQAVGRRWHHTGSWLARAKLSHGVLQATELRGAITSGGAFELGEVSSLSPPQGDRTWQEDSERAGALSSLPHLRGPQDLQPGSTPVSSASSSAMEQGHRADSTSTQEASDSGTSISLIPKGHSS